MGDLVKKKKWSKREVCYCEWFFLVWVYNNVSNRSRGGSGDEPHSDPFCSPTVPLCTHTTPSHDPKTPNLSACNTFPPEPQEAGLSRFPHESESQFSNDPSDQTHRISDSTQHAICSAATECVLSTKHRSHSLTHANSQAHSGDQFLSPPPPAQLTYVGL